MVDINKYIGIDFKLAGRSLDGIDCIGLVSMYLYDIGFYLPAEDGMSIDKDWHCENPARLKNHIKKYCRQINNAEPQRGDLVLYKIYKKPRHIGVVVGPDKFLHIREKKKSSVERLARWERFIDSFWRPIYKLKDREVV